MESHEERGMIHELLRGILSSKTKRSIEIMFLEDIPLELQMDISEYGVPIYERSIHAFPNFRAKTMLLYADFAPIREMFDQADRERNEKVLENPQQFGLEIE